MVMTRPAYHFWKFLMKTTNSGLTMVSEKKLSARKMCSWDRFLKDIPRGPRLKRLYDLHM